MSTKKTKNAAQPVIEPTPARDADAPTLDAPALDEQLQDTFAAWRQQQPLLTAHEAQAGPAWRLDSVYVARELLGRMDKLAPHREAILARVEASVERAWVAERFDRVAPLAMSLLFVQHQQGITVKEVTKLSSEQLKAVTTRARALRALAVEQAPLLVKAKKITQAKLDAIAAGRGLLDQASDLGAYSALLDAGWDTLEPLQPLLYAEPERLTPALIKEMAQVGATLLKLVGRGVDPSLVRGVKWGAQLKANQLLLGEAWEATRRAADYHFWRAQQLAPTPLDPITAIRRKG